MLSTAFAAQAGAGIAELIPVTLPPLSGIVTAAAMALLITACASGGNRPAASGHAGVTRVVLTHAQSQVVDAGVRQMVENTSAQLKAVTATRIASLPGIHVCGYVMTKDANGKDGPDVPFYVELREAEGKPVAERGQVGTDPSKLSKIKFVCRRNG